MEINETQILTPRIQLSDPNLSVWPLKRYDLTYTSNNSNIAKVYKTGKVESLKTGNVIITCKKADYTIYATYNITIESNQTKIECNQEKEIIKNVKNVDSERDMCILEVGSEIKMVPHELKFVYLNGKRTGKCIKCKKLVNYNPPTEFEIYWRNDKTTEGSSYSSCVPSNNPIGSTIVGWVQKINGDKDYRELIAECDNENAFELPTDKIEQYAKFKVIGSGNVTLTLYSKFNHTLKHTYQLELG